MDQEAEIHVAIWQKIFQAQLLWVAEIESRLDVTIPLQTERPMITIKDVIGGSNSGQAHLETSQILDSVDLLYYNICSLHGDPCRRGLQYRQSADLWGRGPLEAIVDSALYFIDVALIGPLDRAAELLANDPRLMAAARARHLYASSLDGWAPRIHEILARADSKIAARAIGGVLSAN